MKHPQLNTFTEPDRKAQLRTLQQGNIALLHPGPADALLSLSTFGACAQTACIQIQHTLKGHPTGSTCKAGRNPERTI